MTYLDVGRTGTEPSVEAGWAGLQLGEPFHQEKQQLPFKTQLSQFQQSPGTRGTEAVMEEPGSSSQNSRDSSVPAQLWGAWCCCSSFYELTRCLTSASWLKSGMEKCTSFLYSVCTQQLHPVQFPPPPALVQSLQSRCTVTPECAALQQQVRICSSACLTQRLMEPTV